MGIDSVIDRYKFVRSLFVHCLFSFSNRNRACQDADELHRAGPGRWGTDEKTFNCIFARYNYYQLRAVFEEYQRVNNRFYNLKTNSNYWLLEIRQKYRRCNSIGIFWRCQRCLSTSGNMCSRSANLFCWTYSSSYFRSRNQWYHFNSCYCNTFRSRLIHIIIIVIIYFLLC